MYDVRQQARYSNYTSFIIGFRNKFYKVKQRLREEFSRDEKVHKVKQILYNNSNISTVSHSYVNTRYQ